MKLFICTLCVALVASVEVIAQARPDFSGTWTMDLARSESAAYGTPAGPVTVAIVLTPSEVKVETTRNGQAQTVRYLPDGTKLGEPSAAVKVGTFKWDGPQLVTNLATYINNQAVTVMEVRNLNPEGTEMSVINTLVVQHGYDTGANSSPAVRNSANTSSGKDVFTRAR